MSADTANVSNTLNLTNNNGINLNSSALTTVSITLKTNSGDITNNIGVGGSSTTSLNLNAAGNIYGAGNFQGTSTALDAGTDIQRGAADTTAINTFADSLTLAASRSENRRVAKGGISRWAANH